MIGRTAFLTAALTALAAAAPAQQPRARTTPPPQYGSLRGVVYDSLAGRPLEGARVLVRGTGFGATTDAGGRFRFDSLRAGPAVLLVEHPALDSVGLSGLAQNAQVSAGRITVVDVAVPSLWTMRRAACRSRSAPTTGDSGLVFGDVRDVANGTRLAGARVVVSWTTARRTDDGVRVERPEVRVVTDSLGNYYACDVSTDYVVTVEAAAGRGVSGRTELLLGERGVGRRDLLVSREAPVVDSLSGLRSGRAVLRGQVRDEFGQPRPSVRVSVDDAIGEAWADSAGRFVLRNLPAGSQMMMARMIGYTAVRQVVELRDDDTTTVAVQMRQVTVLDTIRVTATRRANSEIAGIEERARLGIGYRVPGEALRTRSTMRSVFQGLPNLTVSGPSVYNFQLTTIQSGRLCPVNLYIDGQRGSVDELQSYRPEQLIALEYYPRPNEAPPRFQVGNSCPIAMVWTRFIR